MIQKLFSFTVLLNTRVFKEQVFYKHATLRGYALWTGRELAVSGSSLYKWSAKVKVCFSSQGHLNPSLGEQR